MFLPMKISYYENRKFSFVRNSSLCRRLLLPPHRRRRVVVVLRRTRSPPYPRQFADTHERRLRVHDGRFYRGTHEYAYAYTRTCACVYVLGVRTHSHVYIASRVGPGTAPPRIPDVTTLAHLARRTLEMSPLSPPLPLFRVSRSVGAARSEYALSLPPSLIRSLFPSAAHRRRPAIYSRSSSDGQSWRSRHVCVASPRAVPSTRARHGMAWHGAARRPLSRHSPTRLLARVYYYTRRRITYVRVASHTRARTRTPSLLFLSFNVSHLSRASSRRGSANAMTMQQ